MRPLLVLLLGICGTSAVARVFRESPVYRNQYLVPAAVYSNRRILRSPADARTSRSRVFRNVVVNANGNSTQLLTSDTNVSSLLDEPRLRSQGRFYKRAQAVPTHDVSQHPGKDAIQIMAYNYDEDKHHEKKLVEDGMTMVEAHDFARNLERTTVSVKTEEQTTTPVPVTTTEVTTTTTRSPPPRPEFQQPPAAFAQPPPLAKQVPSRTFSQTVQAGTGIVQPQPPPLPLQTGVPQMPQIPPQTILPGRPPILPQPFPQQPPFPNGLIPAIPGTPALPNPIGIQPDPLQLVVPPQGPLVPPVGLPPQGVVPTIPNLPPPQLPQQPPIPNLPNQFPPNSGGPNGPIPNLPNQIPGVGPNGGPPHNVLPARENRFEVINQQAANSSLEQLGCGFDWITNSCKDVFNIGWCGRCHDFGNIFLHDCKCIQPLVQLPPRPAQQPRPTFLRLL